MIGVQENRIMKQKIFGQRWRNAKALNMIVAPNNHTRWKHKWEWYNCGCVWDKIASEWAGVKERSEK